MTTPENDTRFSLWLHKSIGYLSLATPVVGLVSELTGGFALFPLSPLFILNMMHALELTVYPKDESVS